MGKSKRVRFLDDEKDDFLNNEPNNSSTHEAPNIIDAPKTSEYAFFKRVKKDVGCSYLRSQPQVDKEWRSAERVGGGNFSYTLKTGNPLMTFSSPAEKEKERTASRFSFISPLRDAPTKLANERETGTLDKMKQSNFSFLAGDVTPVNHSEVFFPTASASAYGGNQYFGKGAFAGKRHKLQQQAVETLFPELGEGCSKGFHIVSKLLDRLFPKGCGNDAPELVEEEMDATDHLPTSPTSYRSQKEVHLVHKKTSMELENESSLDDITPTYFHGITKRNLAPAREDSLAIYDTGATFLDYVADPQFIGGYQMRNSSCWFPYENMRTRAFYIKELDEYSDPSKTRNREQHNFLLDRDSRREREKSDLYIPTRDVDLYLPTRDVDLYLPTRDVEDYTYPALRTSMIGHKEQFIGERLDEIAFPSLSFPGVSPKYDLMPYCQPNFYDTQNARRLLEYNNQGDLEPRQSSSRLSFTPKCLTLAEANSIPNVLECDSPSLYCQDNPFSITNVSTDRSQHAVKALILSGGLDIDTAWKFLSLSSTPVGHQLSAYYSSHFPERGELSTSYLTEKEFDTGLHTSHSRKDYVPSSEDAFTRQDCSLTNTLDIELNRRLLIDSSCWDEPYISKGGPL